MVCVSGASSAAPAPPAPGTDVSASAKSAPNFQYNPGTVEDLHKQCQGVFPMFFEGAKILVNKVGDSNKRIFDRYPNLCLSPLRA